jgi:hypothetical protein
VLLNRQFVERGSLVVILFLLWVVPAPSRAQTSPTDMTDMSLSELMSVRFTNESNPERQRWGIGYHYSQVLFEGYRDERNSISLSALLGPPNGETFPILQTRIKQQAHIFSFTYNLTSSIRINVLAPYIRQSTEHISVVPGFSEFTIPSSGAGDAAFIVSSSLAEGVNKGWIISGGLSVPTGSITEKGHTPAGPGSQLPYTMQLGSGTWDIPVSFTYHSHLQAWNWGGQVLGQLRTGQNDRGYRLGHQLLVSLWTEKQLLKRLAASVKLTGQQWGRIKGNDKNFPGPIYPTPVADPDAFGGTKVNLIFGLRTSSSKDMSSSSALRGQTFGLELGFPVYQSLNGPQPEEDYRLNLSWTLSR